MPQLLLSNKCLNVNKGMRMLFYKYSSIDNLSISMLRNGEVFFASPNELNDIHECKPQFIFNAKKEVWDRFVYFLIIRVCLKLNLEPESPLAISLLAFKDKMLLSLLNGKKTKILDYQSLIDDFSDAFGSLVMSELNYKDARKAMQALSAYLNQDFEAQLNDRNYITSFSKSATNLTMWGHYGNAEKGFAIIYETIDGNVTLKSNLNIFPSHKKLSDHCYSMGLSTECSAPLFDVIYKLRPVRANGFRRIINQFSYSELEAEAGYPEHLLSGLKAYDEEDIGRVKSSGWKYEKELRLRLPVYCELASPLRSIKIHAKHIKGVIFGSRTSRDDKEKILSACYHLKASQHGKHHIYVFQARNTPGHYKLDITTLGMVTDLQYDKLPFLTKFTKDNVIQKKEAEKILEKIKLN
ncbi:hypothetical protein CIW58_11020 [Enterobacter cloacae]|nr:hypothetical protein CIW58_11020 [Enterobacter cloacae]